MDTLMAGNYEFVNGDAEFEQHLKATGLSAEFAGTVDLLHLMTFLNLPEEFDC
jgi:hypothetical protein